MNPATEVGPLATATHRDKVEGYIDKGKSEGKLVAGGGRPKDRDHGWFVEPTVFANRIQTGTIGINGYPISIGAPFGGMKASGIGREFGPETFPATLDDIQSGIGLVHNALLLDCRSGSWSKETIRTTTGSVKKMTANSFTALTPLAFLERAADVFADKTAIAYGDRRISYSDVGAQATRLAHASGAARSLTEFGRR